MMMLGLGLHLGSRRGATIKPMFLWGEGDARESDDELPASLENVGWTTNASQGSATPITSLDTYAPNPVRVDTDGATWHGLRGTFTALETMRLGQRIDVAILIQRGTSGAKFRFGFIANPGQPEQTDATIYRDASGVWGQQASGLGEFTTPVVDTVTDDSGDKYERIRTTFTALDVSGESVELRAGPYSAVSGEYVDIHRIGAHIALVPADVSVAIDQTAVSVGDVIGTDVTATVTINDAGKPAIVAGNVSVAWLVNGEVVTGTPTLVEGDTVTARASWSVSGNTGSVDSFTRTAIGWVPKLWGEGSSFEVDNATTASMQSVFSGVAGGTVTALASPDAYLPAPVTIASGSFDYQGGSASSILTGVTSGDVLEIVTITRRGTSGTGYRLQIELNGQNSQLRRDGSGTISYFSTSAGTFGTPVFENITGSDGRTYERMTCRFTTAQSGTMGVRITPNASSSDIELYRIGAVIVPAEIVSPGAPAPGTLIMERPENAVAANDFDSNWAFAAGSINGVLFPATTSFFADGASNVMRVRYNAGSYALRRSTIQGGVEMRQLLPGGPHKEAILEYRFRMRDNFVWVKGGKMPGLSGFAGGRASGGWNDGGWSLRLMWRPHNNALVSRSNTNSNGYLEVYAYWYGMRSPPTTYNTQVYGSRWRFTGELDDTFIDTWHTVRQRVRTNDNNQSNSSIQMWLDGTLMTMQNTPSGSTTNLACELRGPTQPDVRSLYLSTFYGGDDSSWSPANNVDIDYTDFKVWVP